MKNLITLALAAVIFSGSLISCSKEKNEAETIAPDSITGTYTGRQGAGADEPANYLELKMLDQGSLLRFNAGKHLPGTGSWDITGNRFSAFFRQSNDNVKISLAGDYDASENKITGTWGYGDNTVGGGSFYVIREKEKNLVAKNDNKVPGVFLVNFLP